MIISNQSSDAARQQALTVLTAQFISQGHPPQYAQHMATAAIFQTDLELRNAQISRLLNWLKQEHEEVYKFALQVVETTCSEFERRVQEKS